MQYKEVAYGDERELDMDDVIRRVDLVSKLDLEPMGLCAGAEARRGGYAIYICTIVGAYSVDSYVADYDDIDQFEQAVKGMST